MDGIVPPLGQAALDHQTAVVAFEYFINCCKSTLIGRNSQTGIVHQCSPEILSQIPLVIVHVHLLIVCKSLRIEYQLHHPPPFTLRYHYIAQGEV